MSYIIRLSLSAVATVTMMSLLGCGKTYRGPESGLEQYEGDWVYETVRVSSAEGRAFAFVGVSRDISLVTVDEVSEKASTWPERFTMQIDDSTLRVSNSMPGPDFTVPLDGSPGRVSDKGDGGQAGIRLVWRGRDPVVERMLAENSLIIDSYEVASDGSLVITRTVRLGRTMAKSAVEIVYRRAGQPSSRSEMPPRSDRLKRLAHAAYNRHRTIRLRRREKPARTSTVFT